MKALIIKRYKKHHKGDIVTVKEGFYSNYLFPQGIAIKANDENIHLTAKQADEIKKEKQEIEAQNKKNIEILSGKTIKLSATANDQSLYAAIRPSDIVTSIKNQLDLSVEEYMVALPYPIKELGQHSVTIQFSNELSVSISVEINPE